MVLVAAIAGPATPYSVHWMNPLTADPGGPWPSISNSCPESNGTLATPAVRLAQWASAFGTNGQLLSVCSDNFAPALQLLAERLNQRLPPAPTQP
jgi:hypothetical protein